MSVVVIFLILPVLLLTFVGLCFLQVYLSKREGKVPGLIIPGISFLLSLVWPGCMLVRACSGKAVLGMLFVMLIANIPTFIYSVIYLLCREKYRKKRQMDKMNIQDL